MCVSHSSLFARRCNNLLTFMYQGSPLTTSDGIQRRLSLLKHIISLFQNNDIGSKVAAEVTGLLMNEV
jgi:hypothetical protein